MIKRNIKELQPGMLTAVTVYSNSGQALIPDHSVLTTQNIAHLAFYEVEDIYILSENELDHTRLDDMLGVKKEPSTYSQKIKNSTEFKKFQSEYTKRIITFQDSLNDVVKRHQPLDPKELLMQTATLYQGHMTSLSLFDMLHNMRQIDDSTFAHSLNVSLISRMMGKWLGLSPDEQDILTLSGLLHDVGKCMVDPDIIQKPGKLTSEEFEKIKKHPMFGYEIIKDQDLDRHIINSALMHHERYNGGGYPGGLMGSAIDNFAQIVAIADVYDAMTSNRCYRRGLCPFEVIATFEKEGLKNYNPKYILTFLQNISYTYMNNNVLLSDGRKGRIVMFHRQKLSRPVVETDDSSFIDLNEHKELFIEAII